MPAPVPTLRRFALSTPTRFVVTLPRDADLRGAVEAALAPYAEVQRAPASYNLDEIKLIVEIVAGATSVLSNVAAVAAVLLAFYQQHRQTPDRPSPIQISQPGDAEVPPNLKTATEEDVRQWLERSGMGR